MTDEEILRKSFEKAIDGGIDPIRLQVPKNKYEVFKDLLYGNKYYAIIFRHEFTKAFFGEQWRYHGREMFLTEKPLKYLEKFL